MEVKLNFFLFKFIHTLFLLLLFSFLSCLYFLHHFELLLTRFGVDLGVNLCLVEKLLVVFHELSTGLLIQSRFWERHDQQTFDCLENVSQRPSRWIPVTLQGIYANVAIRGCYIWMKDLCQKESFWWFLRELSIND